MVGKKKRKSKSSRLLGSHQKCWLWGRHAVLETLRAGRWRPLELIIDIEVCDQAIVDEVHALTTPLELDVFEKSSQQMTQLCGSGEHQGLMLKMPPYPYASGNDVLENLHSQSAILVLAGIQDPFNFGSILRSADLFGINAVIVPIWGQARVSSHVARSSVGAVNYLEIVETEDLVSYCRQLQERGLQLLAATEKGNQTPAKMDLKSGMAWIIGNEGTGIPPDLLAVCNAEVSIPQQGHVGSLNAAVAAGILCYELRRQRET